MISSPHRPFRRLVRQLALLVALVPAAASAQIGSGDDDPALVPGTPPATYTGEDIGRALEGGRTAVARQVDNAAAYVDSFFGDERYDAEIEDSRLRIGTSVLFEPGEAADFDADLDLRLVLPNTKERLRLVVGGSVQDDDAIDDDTPASEAMREERGSRNLSADLRYLLLADLEQHLDAILGFRISEMTPAAAVGLRYRRSWRPDEWTVRMTHKAEWETKDGFELKSFVDLEATSRQGYFFRATPEILWQQDEPGIEYGLDLSLTRALGETRLLQYVLGYRFVTEPDHELDSILLRARFRQSIVEDRARLEIAPQIRLADADGFDGKPGILLRFEVLF